jgi:DNA repair exonuclease SbcCD ATPase subunit
LEPTTFISVSMRNYKSYGNNKTTVFFNRPGTSFIMGENLDYTEHGASGNGTGKTTIMDALTYCCYDKPLDPTIKLDELVNNINQKHMEVETVFRKGNVGYYMIRRCRKMKAGAYGNYVQLLFREHDDDFDDIANNTDKTLGSKSGDTNKMIETIIGMPYDVFVRVVVVQASLTPFFKLPVSHPTQPCQSDFIENLFNLTVLSEKADCLKSRIKATQDSIASQELLREIADEKMKTHKNALKTVERRIIEWEEDRATKIAEIEQKLTSIDSVDLEAEKKRHALLAELTKKHDVVDGLLVNAQHSLKRCKKKLSDALDQHNHLSDDNCPYCKQKYAESAEKLLEVEDAIANLDASKRQQESDEAALLNELDSLSLNIAEAKKSITVKNVDELIEIQTARAQIEQKLADLKETHNPHNDVKSDLEQTPPSDFDYAELNKLKVLIAHQNFLLKLLTKKDSFVRKAFLSKNLPFLNDRLQGYLASFGLPHKVEFTHDLTANISQFGRSIGFSSLSAGQQARVNIALSLAFRDVLQRIHTPVNVAVMDEILDVGLDDVGIQSVARVIKQKARDEQICLYVISHRSEIETVFDRTVTIQMKDGFSYIKGDKLRAHDIP